MNHKFFIVISLSLALLSVGAAWAKPHGKHNKQHHKNPNAKVNTRWEHRADDNHNGVVGPNEAKDWRQDHQNQNYGNNDPRVNKPWEKKADTDDNGVVEKSERHDAAMKKKSQVDEPWEKAADVNQDGHVSGEEAQMFRQGRK